MSSPNKKQPTSMFTAPICKFSFTDGFDREHVHYFDTSRIVALSAPKYYYDTIHLHSVGFEVHFVGKEVPVVYVFGYVNTIGGGALKQNLKRLKPEWQKLFRMWCTVRRKEMLVPPPLPTVV